MVSHRLTSFLSLGIYIHDFILIEQLGPTFVKLDQWGSTRPDLFPEHLVHKLERLQDSVGVQYPFSFVENTLTKAFGSQWKNMIEVNETPIGMCVYV